MIPPATIHDAVNIGLAEGVPYYERDLLNMIRQGRGVPAVPLVLIGVAPLRLEHRGTGNVGTHSEGEVDTSIGIPHT